MASTVIVVQFNSNLVKFGIAGEHQPRFECIVNDILKRHVPGSHSDDRKLVIDKKLQYLDILNYIFTDKLGLKSKDCTKVVIIEDIFELKNNRDILLSVLLQDVMVAEVTMQPDLFMPILVSSNLSGIVLDIGYKESKAIAIFQGRPLMYTLKGNIFHLYFVDSLFLNALTIYTV